MVTHQEALLWTDGRYFLQAEKQLDSNWQLMKDGQPDTLSIGDWLARNVPKSSYVGIDATLYEEDLFQTIENKLKANHSVLYHTPTNLIDLVWNEYNKPTLQFESLIKLDDAISTAEQAITFFPNTSDLYETLADAYKQKNDLIKALDAIQLAERYSFDDVTSYMR